jgi:hypothetical protein
VALGIAVVVVAGAGRLALPASAAPTNDAAVVAAPAPLPVVSSAAPTAPRPTTKPTTEPATAPKAKASNTPSSSATAASRYRSRKPVAPSPSPTSTHRSTSSRSSSSYSRASTATSVGATSSGDPRSIARAMLAARGWGGQMSCLDPLWSRESGWSTTAGNASGAYGIPQALPGSKMASAGADWRTNPRTQIAWGLSYIASTYGSPCAAWSHSQSSGWY